MQSDRWIRRCDFTAATLRVLIANRMANPDRTKWRRCTQNTRSDRVRYLLRPSKVESPRSPLLRTAPACPATKSRNYMRNLAHGQRSREKRFIKTTDIIFLITIYEDMFNNRESLRFLNIFSFSYTA